MMYTPDATYRVQLHEDFNFRDLQQLLEYFQQLGISTIYASPITEAVSGSQHGYDVINPWQINPDIGTEEELEQITIWLREKGMGWLQDIVPNHMALSTENAMLMDVLERGPLSSFYHYFDINWEHPASKGKLMLFELPDNKPDLEKLKLTVDESGFQLSYEHLKLPLSLPALNVLLGYYWSLAGKDPVLKPLATLTSRVVMIPQMEVWTKYKQSIFRYLLNDRECKGKIVEWTQKASEDKALKKKLLEAQYYSLRNPRESGQHINYRRFFTVNSLICLSMERQSVFEHYHTLLKRLYQQGLLQGLRIDHIDGLAGPALYLQRLRRSFGKDCYIVAEKILGDDETIPAHWPLQGSTGYDFIAMIGKLFTRKDGFLRLMQWYNREIDPRDFQKESVLCRMKILKRSMQGEWDNVFRLFEAAGAFPAKGKWKEAVGAWICCMPVYRAYPEAFPLGDEELRVLRATTAAAVQCFPMLAGELQTWGEIIEGRSFIPEEKILPLLTRLLQFTGPLMAKGVEDTVFYTWNAFIARNEVGDAPDRISDQPVKDFHQAMLERLQTAPLCLNATATHDTKRGEDARIRLLTLAELPDHWLQQAESWFRHNQPLIKMVKRKPAPARNDEYFLYQTLVGALPPDGIIDKDWLERLKQYWLKALREGKTNSSWDEPDEEYETACLGFVTGLFDDNTFLQSLQSFVRETDRRAGIYSLSQLLLKLTVPGIPDIYQGCELPDYSFVDPDNRRPVDYAIRMKWLNAMQGPTEKQDQPWWAQWKEHAARKLFVCAKTLAVRRAYPLLFREGAYIPLGEDTDHTRISFARQLGNTWLIVSCPLPGCKPETEISLRIPEPAPASWQDIFTGRSLTTNDRQLRVANSDACVQILLLMGQYP